MTDARQRGQVTRRMVGAATAGPLVGTKAWTLLVNSPVLSKVVHAAFSFVIRFMQVDVAIICPRFDVYPRSLNRTSSIRAGFAFNVEFMKNRANNREKFAL
jgi:hypothetical protein